MATLSIGFQAAEHGDGLVAFILPSFFLMLNTRASGSQGSFICFYIYLGFCCLSMKDCLLIFDKMYYVHGQSATVQFGVDLSSYTNSQPKLGGSYLPAATDLMDILSPCVSSVHTWKAFFLSYSQTCT